LWKASPRCLRVMRSERCRLPRATDVDLGWSRKHVTDGLGVPLPTTPRADAACVESIRYPMKGRSTRALYLTDDRKQVSCMAVGKGLDGRCGCFTRAMPSSVRFPAQRAHALRLHF
jgi:hypothetical protein